MVKVKPNKMIAITAPSGAGKTTIVKHLLKNYEELCFSVSATTRDKRVNEIDGVDYYFLSKDFKKVNGVKLQRDHEPQTQTARNNEVNHKVN